MTVEEINKYFNLKLKGTGKWREVVRIYYNNTCQECGKKYDIKLLGRKFDVHHLKYDNSKINISVLDKNENIENLILLCHKCHLSIYHKEWKKPGRPKKTKNTPG